MNRQDLDQIFQLFLNNIQCGVMIIDEDLRIFDLNPIACEIFGYSREELIGQNNPNHLWTFVDQNQVPLTPEQYPEHIVLSQNKIIHSQTIGINRSKQGDRKWVMASGQIVRGDSGKLYVLMSFVDITKQKDAFKKLEQEKERLARTESIANIGTWEYNIETQEIVWSDQVFRIFGIEDRRDAPSLEKFMTLVHPDDRDRLTRNLQRSLEEGHTYHVFHRIITPDGKLKTLRGQGKPIKNHLGKVISLHGTVIDITAQAKRENEIRKLAIVAEKTDNAVVITDRDGRVEWVNRGFEKMTEYSLSEVIGKTPGSFLQGPNSSSKTIDEMRSAIRDKEPIHTQIVNYSKSGREFWIDINIQPIFNETGEIENFIALEMDITDRKLYEEELQGISEQLQEVVDEKDEALKTKNRLFSIISHDLRSPFSSIIGYTQLLEEDCENMERGEVKKYASRIHASADRLLRLVENLLQWARSQTGHIRFEEQELNVNEIINKNLEIFNKVAEQKNIQIIATMKTEQKILGDPDMMDAIFRNLFSNAIKFSSSEGTIEISTQRENDTVKIIVKDDGVGMPEDIRCRLFQSGEKLSLKGTAGEKGTGLGLLLCKDFAERNHGTIEVNSEEGVGSSFVLSFPAIKAAETTENLANTNTRAQTKDKKTSEEKQLDREATQSHQHDH
ncbi:MAG: PAS domain S-box protein [Deltaproteobacteria bacterium]|nr:PAS domain S-box protein [Deltaproteobacteria bacterium]